MKEVSIKQQTWCFDAGVRGKKMNNRNVWEEEKRSSGADLLGEKEAAAEVKMKECRGLGPHGPRLSTDLLSSPQLHRSFSSSFTPLCIPP